MWAILRGFLLVSVSFAAGAVATGYFLLTRPQFMPAVTAAKPPAANAPVASTQPPPLPPKVPGSTVLEPDPYARPPAADAPEQALKPRPDEAAEIIDLLRTQFIDAPLLISQPLSADTLEELFAKFGDKARLGETAVLTPDPKQKTILQALTPQNVIYWRPADFSPRELDRLLKQWGPLLAGNPRGLIIDLRNFRAGNDLAGAAAVAGLFVPPQDVLFTVEGLNFPQQVFRSQRQPLGLKQDFPVLALVNRGTRGAAEALALVLRQKGAALLVGKNTAGEGGLFTETRLKSGRFLRLATARVSGFDGTNLLGAPLTPDLAVDVAADDDQAGYDGAYQYGIQQVAAVPAPDRGLLKEREEMDLPLDHSLTNRQAPHDVILNAANDILAGIALSRYGK
ncbi:MAG: S41 family peptidase [Verrucomicrobiales bacterium]|jgi:hypothetical protein|nr:S41 family peptidase [Verrucomicrobiales bacterium]